MVLSGIRTRIGIGNRRIWVHAWVGLLLFKGEGESGRFGKARQDPFVVFKLYISPLHVPICS